jgi:hypothetical protein
VLQLPPLVLRRAVAADLPGGAMGHERAYVGVTVFVSHSACVCLSACETCMCVSCLLMHVSCVATFFSDVSGGHERSVSTHTVCGWEGGQGRVLYVPRRRSNSFV